MADSIQMKVQNFDASGDGHYDLVSAFQKSIRALIQMQRCTILPD